MARHIRPAYLAALQSALADNVRVLLDETYPAISSEDKRVRELEKKTGVGRNTIYRMLKPDQYAKQEGKYSYPGLDTIAMVARALKVTASQLLTPDFAVGHLAETPERKGDHPAA